MIKSIFKISSKVVLDEGLNVRMNYEQAFEQGFIIGIGESFITEWLDELKGFTSKEINEKYSELKGLRTRGIGNRKELTKRMRSLELVTEVVQIDFTSPKHFDKLKNGFILNGVKFVYLLSKGTSTITYVKESLAEEFWYRLDNGRNKQIKFIPAKLNAYYSLSASSSRKVFHQPKHVVVVPDNKTTFEATYLSVTTQGVKEVTEEVTREASDGNGVIDYKLLQSWSDDLGYNGKLSSGVSIRNSFCKGMVFPVDLQEFFEENNVSTITDSWGNVHDTSDIDMIIPESMFKLWQSYSSYAEYEKNCEENGYEFRVCKESHEITASRSNYQMTTDLKMTDEQIERFIAPSIEHLKNITGYDWLSTVLYLNGTSMKESTNGIRGLEQALMIAPELIHDKSVINQIKNQTRKFKKQMCEGRYLIESSYQIASSDLYHFLQATCGIEGDGLLKANEVYSQWHVEQGKTEATIWRSPMIDSHGIGKVKIADSEKLRHFYRFMTEIVVFNDWDCLPDTLAGEDFDGDSNLLLTNDVLLEVHEQLLPVRCEAVKGTKKVCDNLDVLLDSAKLGCDESKYNIGSCINKITAMFSKRSEFPVDSREYKDISDRIVMGLMISQGYIDFKKNGTVVMDMPKEWYSLKHCNGDEYLESICADKKPYFMAMYNDNSKDIQDKYNRYLQFIHTRAMAHWGISGEELLAMNREDLTEQQKMLLDHQAQYCPVFTQDNSTQHRLCKATERALADIKYYENVEDNRTILKNKINVIEEKVEEMKDKVLGLYNIYTNSVKAVHAKQMAFKKEDTILIKQRAIEELRDNFMLDMLEVCEGNKALAINVLIDVLYDNDKATSILWELFSEELIENIISNKGRTMQIPVRDENGEHEYMGMRFKVVTTTI